MKCLSAEQRPSRTAQERRLHRGEGLDDPQSFLLAARNGNRNIRHHSTSRRRCAFLYLSKMFDNPTLGNEALPAIVGHPALVGSDA